MASNIQMDSWEGTWIPSQPWIPTETFKPMSAKHKADWVEFLTSPEAFNAMARVCKEDEEIKAKYSNHTINKDGVLDLLNSSFNQYEFKCGRLYRGFKMYQDAQSNLLNVYRTNKTHENYTALIKHIGAHGHLIDGPIPKKS